MKIGVFGHHPDLFPGFNSLMSANFCYGFSDKGHDVTMLLPQTEARPQRERLEKLGLKLDELDRFGAAEVDFRIIDSSEDIGHFDVIVWQTYFADDEPFFPAIRKAADVVTKNFPRLLTGLKERDAASFKGATTRFDIVGMALQRDHEIAKELFSDIYPEELSRCIYQPRGFRSDWLVSKNDFGGVPVFGVEKGVGTNGEDYAYLVPVVEELRKLHGHIEVIGARFKEPNLTTQHVGMLPARGFYESFLAPLWAYLMIDVTTSRQTMNAVKVGNHSVYPGMYENQIVEAQLAGAVVIGQEDALPKELIASDITGLRFHHYDQTDAIVKFLDQSIRQREAVRKTATDWALRNHSIDSMVNPLLDAL